MRPALLLPLCLLTGCATLDALGGVKPYTPPSQPVPGASSAALVQAARVTAREQGWTVLWQDPKAGMLIAQTPETEEDGVRSRHRWTFLTKDGQLTAGMVLEVQFEPPTGPWETSEVVCDGYGYDRERAQLVRVAQHVKADAYTAVAAR